MLPPFAYIGPAAATRMPPISPPGPLSSARRASARTGDPAALHGSSIMNPVLPFAQICPAAGTRMPPISPPGPLSSARRASVRTGDPAAGASSPSPRRTPSPFTARPS